MAVKIIVGWDDLEFDIYKDLFYNFTPDDWDYMIIGYKEHEVEAIAEKLFVCDYQIKQIDVRWVAVPYHS